MVRRAILTGLLTVLVVAGGLVRGEAEEPARWTMKATVAGQSLEGWPLHISQTEVHLLGRDGYLYGFAAGELTDYAKAADTFTPLTAAEIRGRLLREFGSKFDVTGTGHYLVVHPAGQRDYWADRFEQLYRSFVHYFSVRGLKPKKLEFPLVAIVVKDQQELFDYAAKERTRIAPRTLGYYSPRSNRVILYDQGNGAAAEKNWAENSATIIHEATHQSAFNTGVHSRMTLPPRWLGEGLGTMFEAPGVWSSAENPHLRDRLNRGRLKDFRPMAAHCKGELLQAVVATDELFVRDTGAAYALSWALTFHLMETQHVKFCEYLAKTASRTPFEEYTPAQRLADFEALFGRDYAMLNTRFLRFISELPE